MYTEAVTGLLKLQQPKDEDREVVSISEIGPAQIDSQSATCTGTESSSPSQGLTWLKDPQPPTFRLVPLNEEMKEKLGKKGGHVMLLKD